MNQATIINPPSSSDISDDFVSAIGDSPEHQPSFRDRTTQAWSSIRDGVSNAKVRCGEFYDGAREKVTVGARTTDEAIRTHPYTTMAVAAGVGVLIGLLIGRRRSKETTDTQ